MFIEGFVVDKLDKTLTELITTALKEPISKWLDEKALKKAINQALVRAEKRFIKEYGTIDIEMTEILTTQTYFIDLPTVQDAAQEIVKYPFRNLTSQVETFNHSFSEVLPKYSDRTRIDAAVNAFLNCLGQEVLEIDKLQPVYQLLFTKINAENNQKVLFNSKLIEENTAKMLENTNILVDQIAQLPNNLIPLITPSTINTLPEHPYPWHNLPQRPYTHFVGRENEFRKIIDLLLPHPKSRHYLIAIDGIGGLGKSSLALELGYYYLTNYASLASEERFEFIIWISAKLEVLTAQGVQLRSQTINNLSDIYREIALVLELPSILEAEPEQRRRLVERALTRHRTLIILDNLETVDDEHLITFLLEVPDPTKVLLTSRYRVDGAYPVRLSDLPLIEAHKLIEVEASDANIDLEEKEVEQLYQATSGLPLAIVWSLGLLNLGYSIETIVQKLDSGESELAHYCFDRVIASIRSSDAYRLLAALTLFETSVDRSLLGEVAEISSLLYDEAIAKLLQLSLLYKQNDCFFALPLTKNFMSQELKENPLLEKSLREKWVEILVHLAQPYTEVQWYWQVLEQIQKQGLHINTLVNWAHKNNRNDLLVKALPAQIYYYDLLGLWEDISSIGLLAVDYAETLNDVKGVISIQLYVLNWFYLRKRRYHEAERTLTKAIEIAKNNHELAWQCEGLLKLSELYRWQGKFDYSIKYCREAWELSLTLPKIQLFYARMNIENELGKIAREQQNWKEALSHFLAVRGMLSHGTAPAYQLELAWGVLGNIGFLAQQLNRLDEAARTYEYCLTTFRKKGNRSYMTATLVRLATLEEQRNNLSLALGYAKEALEWSRRLEMLREEKLASDIISRVSKLTLQT